MFLNRVNELADLETRYQSNQAEFVVLWGRRRVGKTSLVWAFCQDKPSVFYFSERASSDYLLREFSQKLRAVLEPEHTAKVGEFDDFSYPDWYTAFQQMAILANNQRIVIVIDEYPYLAESVPGVSTALQKAWDLHLSKTNIFFVLTGSTISLMSNHVLDATAPLYGRHTWALELKSLLIYDIPPFLPHYTATQCIETYAVLGGMPGYLQQFDDQRPVITNISRQIVSVSGSLFGSARLNIFEEISDPGLHLSVIEVIASGAHKPADIGRLAAIRDRGQLRRILLRLKEVRLIEARVPLDRDRGHQRQPGYFIADPYIRFWFRYIKPHMRLLEMREGEQVVLDEIRSQWGLLVAPTWEEIARTHLLRQSARRQLPFYLEEVGSWFSAQAQLDIVGINRRERRVLFGEVKWQRPPATIKTLDRLITQSQKWLGRDPDWDVYYTLFAQSFGAELEKRAAAEGDVFLYTPEDVV
ncbi:MAG: ATP-binding protein [Chloroflexota bacterium]